MALQGFVSADEIARTLVWNQEGQRNRGSRCLSAALSQTFYCACRVAWMPPTVKDVVKTHPQDNEPLRGLQAPTCYSHTDPSMLPRKYSGKGDTL